MLLGSLGLLRFPDLYTRLHGTGVSSTIGIALLITAVILNFSRETPLFSILAGLTLLFIFLTYPLATTAIIWAAHRIRVPIFSGTLTDEWELYEHEELPREAGIYLENFNVED
jgi:multicomponent Na+:H+ antiporter subunit G